MKTRPQRPALQKNAPFRRLVILFFLGVMTLQLGGGTVRKAAGADDAICRTDDHRTFSVYIENDSFAGGDNQYTSGLKLTWSRFGLSELPDDAWLHKWLYPVIKKIGFDRPASAEKALTFSVGQSIYTPDDINRHE